MAESFKESVKKIVIKYKIFKILPISWIIALIRWFPRYVRYNFDYFTKSKKLADNRFKCDWFLRFPCLNDATSGTGFDAHYIYHTAWAARMVIRLNPEYHVDISSSLYFACILSAAVPVRFYDYRPADIKLSGLKSGSADLLKLGFDDNSIKSLSCMHVMEHIGLGRYGDPFDPKGDLTGISELKRVLAPGGGDIIRGSNRGYGKITF